MKKTSKIYLAIIMTLFAIPSFSFGADISEQIKSSVKEFSPLFPNAKKDEATLAAIVSEFCKMTVASFHHGDINKMNGKGNPDAVAESDKKCKFDMADAKSLYANLTAQESTIRSAHLGCTIGANLWVRHPKTKIKVKEKILAMPKKDQEDGFADVAELLSVKICPPLLREVTKKK